ncbi:hypothetical protein JMJ35_004560 [Cladonia borealis]|uniref:Uncharacterized protein n=1 Tax=Cladonia borealis TaxID=184061 RepID=A0AA39R392_9LECA|nr:hypothetical protein JMJ35_004560 [Cladonia borealis]
MTDIYSHILQPDAAANPDDCDDFELREAYMSYNRTDAGIIVGSHTYEPDFNIYGSFLLFRQPVSVSLRIKGKRQGFRALAKSKLECKFEGVAAYQGDILGVENPEVTFIYQNGKWSFSGWKIKRNAYWNSPSKLSPTALLQKPFSPDDGLASMDNVPVNMDKAIELGSNADSKKGCGRLVDFVSDQLVRMQFEFDRGMPATEQSALEPEKHTVADDKSKCFRFTVTWYFTMAIKNPISGADTPIATRIKLQDALAFLRIQPYFLRSPRLPLERRTPPSNLSELGTKMLDHEVLGKIAESMVLERLGKTFIEDLVCREPEKAEELKEEAKKRNEEQRKGKEKEADKVKEKMDETKEKAERQGERKSEGEGVGGVSAAGGGGATGFGVPIGMGIGVVGGGGGGRGSGRTGTGSSGSAPETQTNPPIKPDSTPSPIYGSFSLLDLIKLYVAAVHDIDKIKPEDLRSGHLATVLARWTWANSKADAEKNYQELMAKLAEVNKSKQATKRAIQRRMNLRDSEADRTAETDFPGISAKFAPTDDESWIDIDISRALPLRKWVQPDDYAGVDWHVYLSADKIAEQPADDDIKKLKAGFVVYGTSMCRLWDVALVSPGLGDGREEATENKNTLFRARFFSATGAQVAGQVPHRRPSATGPSAPSDSFQTLPVLPPPAALNFEMNGGNIVVSWATGTTTQHVAIQHSHKETQRVVACGITAAAAPVAGVSSRLALTLFPEELVEGKVLSVVAGASLPPDTGTLCLLAEASVTVSFPLNITIGDDSNWDIETEIFALVVVTNKNIPTATGSEIGSATLLRWQVAVVPPDTANREYEYADITPRSVQAKQAVLRMKLPAATLGSSGSGTTVIMRAALTGSSDRADAEWTLPSLSGTATDIGEVSHAFEDGKRLVLTLANG